jgi:hypothetical protein
MLPAIEGQERWIARGVARAYVHEMQDMARMVLGYVTGSEVGWKTSSWESLVKTRLSKVGNDASHLNTLGT